MLRSQVTRITQASASLMSAACDDYVATTLAGPPTWVKLSTEFNNLLVENHAAVTPAILKRDFLPSLVAAYRLEEIQQQLRQAQLEYLQTQLVSDRHIIVFGRFYREI